MALLQGPILVADEVEQLLAGWEPGPLVGGGYDENSMVVFASRSAPGEPLSSFAAQLRADWRGSFAFDFANDELPGRFQAPRFPALAMVERGARAADAVLVWAHASPDDPSDLDLRIARRSDGARAMPGPVPGLATAGDVFFPMLTSGPDGDLHLAWLDTRFERPPDDADAAPMDVMVAVSWDGGASWRERRLTPASFSSAPGRYQGGNASFLGD